MAEEVDTETKGETVGLQRGRNVLSGKANLIIVAPGEGQEVIIKSTFGCRDSDGNTDHTRQDAAPPHPHPRGQDRLKVSGVWTESDIVFRHTRACTHSVIDGWANMHSYG